MGFSVRAANTGAGSEKRFKQLLLTSHLLMSMQFKSNAHIKLS